MAQSEPSLAALPFVVCERGDVVAASPLALKAGVCAGMSSGRAQSRCAAVMIVTRDRSREVLAWDEIQRTFYGLTPKVEPIVPGLLFADVDGRKVAPAVIQWCARGGQGTDRATAQLAALTSEPKRVRSIRHGQELSFADEMLLTALLPAGLSEKVLRRLSEFGCRSVGSVRKWDRRQVEEQFHPHGELLFSMAQGPRHKPNLRPVPTWNPPEEVTDHLSFELPCREPGEWEPAIDVLLQGVCSKLGSRSAQSIEVIADTAINPVSSRRLLKEPISKPQMLQKPALSALSEALGILAPLPPVVLGLEVRLSSLVSAPGQASLWEETDTASDPATQAKRLVRTLERIDSRFQDVGGQPVMGRFTANEPDAPFHDEGWNWLPALQEIARQRKDEGQRKAESQRGIAGQRVTTGQRRTGGKSETSIPQAVG